MYLLIIHLCLSFVVALIAAFLLKQRFESSFLKIFFSLFGLNLMLPVVGYIITILLAPLMRYVKHKHYIHDVETFNKEEFFQNPYPQIKRLFGEGAVISLCKDKDNHSPNKMKGLVFMSQNPTKQTNQLIRGLLSDQNNEIRLYSFSLLNAKEEELNSTIASLLQKYESYDDVHEKSLFAAKIAFSYWEYIHLGIVDEESEETIIDKVLHFATQAPQKDKKVVLLLAKVAFKKKEFQKSSQLFLQAIDLGIDKSIILPYLAEIAFEKRAFQEVKSYMQQLQPIQTSFFTNPLYSQWSR